MDLRSLRILIRTNTSNVVILNAVKDLLLGSFTGYSLVLTPKRISSSSYKMPRPGL